MIRIVVASLVVAIVAGLAASLGGAASPLPLSARLIQAADFPGYVPERSPKAYRSARTWTSLDTSLIPSQVSADVARLHREGFKEVLLEYLDRAPGKQNGISWVMQLGSAAAARAELAASLAEDKAQTRATRPTRYLGSQRLAATTSRATASSARTSSSPTAPSSTWLVKDGRQGKKRAHPRRPRRRRHQAPRESPGHPATKG